MTSGIFAYTDYRQFLKDFYNHHKQATPGFSHRTFLAKAGMTGPNYLKNIIDGKKNISIPGIGKFAKALGLGGSEKVYFKNLVLFNQETVPEKKRRYFNKLSEFSAQSPALKIQEGQLDYFKNWYNVAVREHIHAHPFSGNYGALARSLWPRITPQKAREAVELLERLGMVRKGDDGVYVLTDPIVTTGADFNYVGAHAYYRSILDISRKALDKIPSTKRYYRAMTGSCSPETHEKIKLELDAARKRIIDLIAADQGKRKVFQLNMQFFPLQKDKSSAGQTAKPTETES